MGCLQLDNGILWVPSARVRREIVHTLQGRPQPVITGRLARTALLVVLIVLTLGPWILDSRIPVGQSPAILATLASVFYVISHSELSSLRATGR